MTKPTSTTPVRNTSLHGYPDEPITPKVDETADWFNIFKILARARKDSTEIKTGLVDVPTIKKERG